MVDFLYLGKNINKLFTIPLFRHLYSDHDMKKARSKENYKLTNGKNSMNVKNARY